MDLPEELACTKCGETKNRVEGFHKCAAGLYGVRRDCKACLNQRRRDAHENTREADRAKGKAWREAHPGYQAKKTREWHKANPERSKAKRDAFYERNPDYSRTKSKEWREANPEKHAAKQAQRRAIQKGVTVEKVDHLVVFERDGWQCKHCARPTPRENKVPNPLAPTLDHIVPLTKGGEHSYANTQLLCFRCNNRKGNRFTG